MTEELKHSTVTWETYRETLINKTLHAFYLRGWFGLPILPTLRLANDRL